MPGLTDEIEAYEAMKDSLEAEHSDQWVVVHAKELVGTFNTFEEAAAEAVAKFGRGPYLIRQIGVQPTFHMPAALLYNPIGG